MVGEGVSVHECAGAAVVKLPTPPPRPPVATTCFLAQGALHSDVECVVVTAPSQDGVDGQGHRHMHGFSLVGVVGTRAPRSKSKAVVYDPFKRCREGLAWTWECLSDSPPHGGHHLPRLGHCHVVRTVAYYLVLRCCWPMGYLAFGWQTPCTPWWLVWWLVWVPFRILRAAGVPA